MIRSEVIILDFQYLRGNGYQKFVKELAFTRADSVNVSYFHFLPPFAAQELTPAVRKSNDYCSEKINLLRWENGYHPYNLLAQILNDLSEYKVIFVHGEEKRKFLSQYLDNVHIIPGDINFGCLPNYTHSCLVHNADFKRCAWHHVCQLQFYLEKIRVYDC